MHYTEFISRAMTQRLHSPSLSPSYADAPYSTVATTKSFEGYELGERVTARRKLRWSLRALHVSWEEFVRDVATVEKQVHVLSPTVYAPPLPLLGKSTHENLVALTENASILFSANVERGESGAEGRKDEQETERQRGCVEVMRNFGKVKVTLP
ncbi:hypothetical protein T440DRAFT_116737 [Plenodomus tracheiphilus IPT5]|uniref:Uncharacterized protein n=1 Tax=Plenodomus tracheiphilus IPT5 TaxID=1408161 RepID=A0A6A7B4G0_9PLEO|nr:hypothetical protein T440DRAFT_116737 [Plenodomus tracheiphilus IPT5]